MTVLGRLIPATFRTLQRLTGVAVRYHYNDEQFISIELAVRTRPKPHRQDIVDGIGFDSLRWDWLIAPECLVDMSGNPIVPTVGHRIERLCDKLIHMVVRDPRENCWRWSDDSHAWRRVYTEELS